MAYVDFGFPLKCPFVLWFSCKKNNQLRVIQARDGTRKHYGPILTLRKLSGRDSNPRCPFFMAWGWSELPAEIATNLGSLYRPLSD